uniref:HMG box domain-containing protein n=1 Tax=Entomoneis paludosa TaxID=265537 RepID=A0A7S3DWY5_9STRA|eukprot:CAMPEP_0172439368 /NCGR_PEP_ID=MMETSP1065-20121228/382_1 /TAXON_ID=265537 /ORGANISM="Amphiprora paludosa, Strain CCMP125" /LENGTH=238 /DNA_ID=CAMNT_0013188043 /DNA_START=13 /DNA_END=729 /DNA_ORIENTATION=-
MTISKDTTKAAPAKSMQVLTRPSRPLSAYNLFFRDTRKRLLGQQPAGQRLGFANMAKSIGASWREIKSDQKQKYELVARGEKLRYKKAMAEWKKFQRAQAKKRAAAAQPAVHQESTPPPEEHKDQNAHFSSIFESEVDTPSGDVAMTVSTDGNSLSDFGGDWNEPEASYWSAGPTSSNQEQQEQQFFASTESSAAASQEAALSQTSIFHLRKHGMETLSNTLGAESVEWLVSWFLHEE